MYEYTFDYYTISQKEQFITDTINKPRDLIGKRNKYTYNVPCSFDIETTSCYINGEKRAFMYIWQFAIFDKVLIGRTWQEFIELCEYLQERLVLSDTKKLIVYVHNLAYEFAFIARIFQWQEVFAIRERKPLYCISNNFIEFRCSYMLSGYSLQKVGENLEHFKIRKLIGDLDYELIRTSKTPLTKQELKYCINDVKVVNAFIQEEIERNGNILNIPLTKTGYVRRYCRLFTLNINKKSRTDEQHEYKKLISSLRINDIDEYNLLKRAFMGGFTHSNPFHSSQILSNVASNDLTSAYPSFMCGEMFPMSTGERITIHNSQELKKMLKYYCCVFTIELFDVQSRFFDDSYLSRSKCFIPPDAIKSVQENNGRIVKCEHLITSITNVDFELLQKCYTISKYKIHEFIRYKKGYLPKLLIESILHLYKIKTELKGVQGKETELLHAKANLNSTYGMCVTDIIQELITYDGNSWITLHDKSAEELLKKHNSEKGRFLFYPWGIFITAYCRRTIFNAILHLKHDYVYADTDSVKYLNYEKHLDYFNNYNNLITQKIKACLNHYNLDTSLMSPCNIKGISKPIGVFDYEGTYRIFKSNGAKRYMYYINGKMNFTISGLNKKTGVPYLCKKYGKIGVFEHFTGGLYLPPSYSGKKAMTYIDSETTETVTDYLGHTCTIHELTSVHMENSDYTMTISSDYQDYIENIKEYYN